MSGAGCGEKKPEGGAVGWAPPRGALYTFWRKKVRGRARTRRVGTPGRVAVREEAVAQPPLSRFVSENTARHLTCVRAGAARKKVRGAKHGCCDYCDVRSFFVRVRSD